MAAKYDINLGSSKQVRRIKLPPLAVTEAVLVIQRTERCRMAKKVGLKAKKEQVEREYERKLLHMEDLSDNDVGHSSSSDIYLARSCTHIIHKMPNLMTLY